MIRKREESGIIAIVSAFFIIFVAVICNYYWIAVKQEYVAVAKERAVLKVSVGDTQGTIYDSDLNPLVNSETTKIAVAVPTILIRDDVVEFAVNQEEFLEEFDKVITSTNWY